MYMYIHIIYIYVTFSKFFFLDCLIYTHIYAYLSIYLSIYLSTYLLSIYLSIYCPNLHKYMRSLLVICFTVEFFINASTLTP